MLKKLMQRLLPKRQEAKPIPMVSSVKSLNMVTVKDVGTITLTFGTYHHIAIKLGTYFDRHQPALRIYSVEGEPLTTASYYVEHGLLGEQQIYIRNWGDNAGIVDELERLNVVKRTGKVQPVGREAALICDLQPVGDWGQHA